MSVFDTIDDIKFQIGRFLWPTLFLVAGLYLLYFAMTPEMLKLSDGTLQPFRQSPLFLYGAIFFIVGSVVWYLYLFGLIKSIIGYVVLTVMLGASAYLLYIDYKIIDDDVKYIERYEKINNDIIARMIDIKTAQIAFKEYNRYYTNNLDSLIHFVKTGKKLTVPNIGSLPERKITPEERDYIYKDNRPIDKLMTEQEANILAKMPNPPADLVGFSRDTVYKDVLTAVFDQKYLKNRDKAEPSLGFHPDSLKYVPHTSVLVTMDTASVQKGEIKVPTLMIKMVHPMNEKKVYQIGDLYDNHLRDNWSR